MTECEIRAQDITGCDLDRDGGHMSLNFIAPDGRKCSLSLPTACLQSLIMTLPGVMEQALRLRYKDDSLRLVYPAATISIELSSDQVTYIVTLKTPDGFAVSFSLSEAQMHIFGEALAKHAQIAATLPKAN